MFGRTRLTASGRVAVTMTVVVAAGVILLASVAYVAVLRSASSELDATLLREVEAFTAAIHPASTTDERSLAEVSRAYLGERTGGEGGFTPVLLLRLESGRVISNSDIRLEHAPENAALLDPSAAARGFDTIEFESEAYRTATAPIEDVQGHAVAAFQAAAPTSSLRDLARNFAVSLSVAGLVVVSIGAGISRWAASRSLLPLRRMADEASRISFASLDERVSDDGTEDELGTLAASLNAMLDRLENAVLAQKRFVADASHELRTPIAVIRGNVDLLQHPQTSAAEKAEAILAIEAETRRTTLLLEELLDLARSEGGVHRTFQPVEVATLLTEATSKARALGERRFACTCEPDVWVHGDPDLLERALLNLLRNAVEHAAGDSDIEVACSVDQKRVNVAVRDHGPGIPAADLPRVFDRFHRSALKRASGSGSGLGLAITKALVEMHGGVISARNAPDGGAIFSFSLPRIEPPA